MERMEQNALGTEKVGKLLKAFALPAILGMLINALYNVLDKIIIGQGVGELALGAISIATPVTMLMLALGLLVGDGAGTLFAMKLGEGKKEDAEKIVSSSLLLVILLEAFLLAIVILYMEPILLLLGATSELLPYARDYTSIVILGGIFQGAGIVLNGVIRSEGNPKLAMQTMLAGVFTNMLLDPLFVFGFKWGAKGAALGTVIGQFVSCATMLLHFYGKKSVVKISFSPKMMVPSHMLSMSVLGSSTFIMQMATGFIYVLYNHLLGYHGGSLAIGSYTIVSSIVMLATMPFYGITQAMQPIISFNHGANLRQRVKDTVKIASVVTFIFGIVVCVVIMCFADFVTTLFTANSPELSEISARGLRISFLVFPLVGFQMVGAKYFQSIGKAVPATILGLVRQILILIPALVLLASLYGVDGVYVATPVSDLLAFGITLVWLIVEMKKSDILYKKGETKI